MNAVAWALLILGAGIVVLFVAGGTVAFAARRTAGPDTDEREPVDEQPATVADGAAAYLAELAGRRRPPVVPGRDLLGDVGKCSQCGRQTRSASRGCSWCGHGRPQARTCLECGGTGCAWCGHARTKPRVVAPYPAPPVAEPEPLKHARFQWAPFLSTPPADGCAIYPRSTQGGEPS